jgi:hypothetical protein
LVAALPEYGSFYRNVEYRWLAGRECHKVTNTDDATPLWNQPRRTVETKLPNANLFYHSTK